MADILPDRDELEKWQVPESKQAQEVTPNHSRLGSIYYNPVDSESQLIVPNLGNIPGVQYEIIT